MHFIHFVLIFCALQRTSNGFFLEIEKSFDLSKFRGPVPKDKDVYRNVSQLIKSNGYPCEEHFVETEDNFILNIQRIPHGRNENNSRTESKPIVFLQHGLLADSACWVFNFPDDSLAYILADNGFDVWLGNSRGNRYARRNTHLSPECLKFWKWSFDDLAKYDLPATVDYIRSTTKQDKLVYIGHSQGTLIAFAAFSTNPELAKKIKLFVALAPIATIGNINVPFLRTLAEVVTVIDAVAPLIDAPFFPGDIWRTQFVEKGFCNGLTEEKLCYQVAKFVVGDDPTNVNYSRIPVFLNNFPSGTSLRNMVHFAQLLLSGKCQMFDYGIIENYFHYGQAKPPQYNVSKITVPIAVFSGSHDTLSDPADVKLLLPRLKSLVYNKYLEEFNHVDFVMGLNANVVLYPYVVELAKKYSSLENGRNITII
ncbi:gastric triacylglycerol lipase-like [Dendronephthya gigantea]|uniref:gastric triacylglycerol lipase-like n=1 Tax=Dendronephthya gigantea TaxID=151771 RepID=UPI00106958E8|nr:gastric triacylglycerol lipase-like [Dendronephthya gigantea]